MKEKVFSGIAASPGFVVGKAYLFDVEETAVSPHPIAKKEVGAEIARFEDALIETRKELINIRQELADRAGRKVTDLFDAHLLVVEDRTLIAEVVKGIEERKLNAEYVFQSVIQEYTRAFLQVEDDYIKERLSDIRDVARRVLHNLTGRQRADLASLEEEVVVIAPELSPSDTALMHREKVAGFATDAGGKTSHTAIMARSLEIPAVVGLGDISASVSTGDPLVVDGTSGKVIVFPTRATLARVKREQSELIRFEAQLEELKDRPAETRDGYRITLAANIEMPEDLDSVVAHGGEGVGLYRTEYFYLNRIDLPDEDEQFQAYSRVATTLQPASVIIRTLDLGGDKFNSALEIPPEFIPVVREGIEDAARTGYIAGYPMTDMTVTVTGGSFSEGESTELAYKAAAAIAFKDAVRRAGPVLLEPIMDLQVITPPETIGGVIADLGSRRGKVHETIKNPKRVVIRGHVPLAELFGYATTLRSLTQGRGSYTMEPAYFDIK